LECLMLERNPLAEILAEGNAGADPRSIQEEPSGPPAGPAADLQVGVSVLFSGPPAKDFFTCIVF
jgi:hypothetical protein